MVGTVLYHLRVLASEDTGVPEIWAHKLHDNLWISEVLCYRPTRRGGFRRKYLGGKTKSWRPFL